MIDPADLVLVAIINNRRDLELVRVLGWYRIPLRFAPKIVAVDAIAFYQTSEFGEEKWSIRFAAQVKGVELVRRVDLLKEEPNHPRASEEYYKIQMGPLELLPHPILVNHWRRITFFYTTGERLLSADEVGDLAIRDEERNSVWRSLRDRKIASNGRNDPELLYWEEALQLFGKWYDNENNIDDEGI